MDKKRGTREAEYTCEQEYSEVAADGMFAERFKFGYRGKNCKYPHDEQTSFLSLALVRNDCK